MTLPKYDEIQLPALKLMSDGNIWKFNDMADHLCKFFSLSDEEKNQMYDSGKG